MPVRPCCASLEPRLLLNGTLTVNSNADNTDSDNTLTLREAILVADGRLGRELTAQELAQVRGGIFAVGQNWFDDIVFANGVGTIRPTSPLPALGSRDDVNGRMPDGTKVVLSGENAGGGASGLVLGDGFGTTNIVVDLVIRNFSSDGLFAEGPVGCLLTGLTVASNGGHGIVLVSGRPLDGIRTHPSNNQIGGGPFTPAAGMRNYVYSNGGDGIRLEKLPSAPSSRPVLPNVFLDNYVGLRDDAGDADFGNAGHGIHFVGASGNAVASNSVSPPRPNVVSGNGGDGIRVEGVGATSNIIQGNFIGTTPSGGARLGNDGAGVAIVAGAGFANAIGLSNTVSNNVIAANAVGVRIDGVGTNGASLTGNYLGTNRTGAPGLGNRGAGVLITGGAQNVFVGGINTGRNFIAGNAGPGVDVAGAGTDRNNVIGNYVGTVDGRTALPNAVGVRARDGAGAVQVADNRVGGNTGAGIEIIGTAGAESAALLRNAVGLGILTTTSPLPNGGDGIVVGGGARGVALDGNVVAGNLGSGIHLRDAGTDGTVLTNNSIGTGTPGTPLGNAGPGLRINGASNTRTVRLGAISGVNTIVFNGGAGVLVGAGSGNELTNVSVFANGGLGSTWRRAV